MEIVEFEFVKLDKLPTPKRKDEVLFEKDKLGVITAYNVTAAGMFFDFMCGFHPDYTYFHLKATAKSESKPFKIGDEVIVEYDGFHLGKIVEFLDDLIGVKVDMFKTIYAVPERVQHQE